MPADIFAIAISGFVKEIFYNCILIIKLSQGTRYNRFLQRTLGESQNG